MAFQLSSYFPFLNPRLLLPFFFFTWAIQIQWQIKQHPEVKGSSVCYIKRSVFQVGNSAAYNRSMSPPTLQPWQWREIKSVFMTYDQLRQEVNLLPGRLSLELMLRAAVSLSVGLYLSSMPKLNTSFPHPIFFFYSPAESTVHHISTHYSL